MIASGSRFAGRIVVAGERIRKVMEQLDRHHFWFALSSVVGLLACMATHAIDAQAGAPMVSLIAGHYLGRSHDRRRQASRDRSSAHDSIHRDRKEA